MTLTVPESAELLGIGRNKAYDAARKGEIPTIKIGKRLLVPTVRLKRMLHGFSEAEVRGLEAQNSNTPEAVRENEFGVRDDDEDR